MDKQAMADLLAGTVKGCIRLDEPMKYHTSFKIGGLADILVAPEGVEALLKTISLCREQRVPYFVMGNGTNLLVRDKGIRGVVIQVYGNLSGFEITGCRVRAEAGVLLSKLASAALNHGLSGLEFASGIPGTLGGAVTMNAGAYNGEMKDIVVKTDYLDGQGNVRTLEGAEHRFGYRTSFIQEQGGVVLCSELLLKEGRTEEIRALMEDLAARRRQKQPLEMPSAGSVFKRPQGHFTGQLIENCGLKGFCCGGAQVSPKHCGFIVNTGEATAEDVLGLIAQIRDKVRTAYGVELETEIRIVGEE